MTRHPRANRERAASAKRDIQPLSRMFYLARNRHGFTTFNPCDAIAYLPERPRDQYATNERYAQIDESCESDAAVQAGEFGIKRNALGRVVKPFEKTPDLWSALGSALELRRKNRGGAARLPNAYLSTTQQGKPYAKKRF